MYSKCVMPKPKSYSSKKYKKFHGIASQKLSCIWSKSMKNGSQMKNFQSNVNTLVGGSYMFISTGKIGHLTSC